MGKSGMHFKRHIYAIHAAWDWECETIAILVYPQGCYCLSKHYLWGEIPLGWCTLIPWLNVMVSDNLISLTRPLLMLNLYCRQVYYYCRIVTRTQILQAGHHAVTLSLCMTSHHLSFWDYVYVESNYNNTSFGIH